MFVRMCSVYDGRNVEKQATEGTLIRRYQPNDILRSAVVRFDRNRLKEAKETPTQKS